MNSFILIFIIYLLVINLTSFFIMKIDKIFAIKQKRRISEKTLFLLAIFLGGMGIYFGMYVFRHKTKHMKFVIGIPIIIIFNLVFIYYFISHAFLKL